jgi:hypothetical protein
MKILFLLISLAVIEMATAQCGVKISESVNCVYGAFQKKVEKKPDVKKMISDVKECFASSGCNEPKAPEGHGKKDWKGKKFDKIGKMLEKIGITLDKEKVEKLMEAGKKCGKQLFKDKLKDQIAACMKTKDQLSDFQFPEFIDKIGEDGEMDEALKMMMMKFKGKFGRRGKFGRKGKKGDRSMSKSDESDSSSESKSKEWRKGRKGGRGRRERGGFKGQGIVPPCIKGLVKNVFDDEVCPTEQNKADVRACIVKLVDDNIPEDKKCINPVALMFMMQDKRKAFCDEVKECKEGLGDDCKAVKEKALGYACECGKKIFKESFDDFFADLKSCVTTELGEAPFPEPMEILVKGFMKKKFEEKQGGFCAMAKRGKGPKFEFCEGKGPFMDDDEDDVDDEDFDDDDVDDDVDEA